ncbi:MAG TPA: isoprenyl transferase [Candidatus Omnitrophota bacterium]|nr:isoprenyl transferase [Candidatus Omnitrophota bacterium]HRZ15443.1 isoprenyl transferase [Candidatus Omnitrophota bacterium]
MAERRIPHHIAIIMDGNGRWAQQRHLPRTMGHSQGAKRVKEVVKAASDYGVKALTLFAFSSENWSRPAAEIRMLMRYFSSYLDRELNDLHKRNIVFRVIGREHPLPAALIKKIRAAEERTRANTGLIFVLAINYGARQELVDACRQVCAEVQQGALSCQDIDEKTVARRLYTHDLPDPDLLIRTSGEQRISNFLLWQLSYAEFYFPQKLWPDFTRDDLAEAIEVFAQRRRRFGGIDVPSDGK